MGRWNERFDEESDRLIGLAHELDEAQWRAPSLCERWRVCDVYGHMTMGASFPIAKVGWLVATRYRGNVHRGSAEESIALGDLPKDDLVARFEASRARPIGIGRALPAKVALNDNAIHELDVRLALGLSDGEHAMPEAFAADVLGLCTDVSTPLLPIARWNRGLTLRATDMGWERPAKGPTVEGPAEWLIAALAGRAAGLDRVTGDGVETLRSRSTPSAPSRPRPVGTDPAPSS